MAQKCIKCKNSLNKPYYTLIKTITNERKFFCVSCWNKEEKDSRHNPGDFVKKVGRDGKVKDYNWDEDNKQWQTENGEVDEDCKESNGNNRERERANSNSDCWIRGYN